MSENIGDSERNLWIAVITNASKRGKASDERFLESNWCKMICCWVDINHETLVKAYKVHRKREVNTPLPDGRRLLGRKDENVRENIQTMRERE